MSTFLIVGTAGANVDFGTTNVAYTAVGTMVQGGQLKCTGDKLELKDKYGNVAAVIYFNEKGECSVDVIFDTTSTLPARGDILSMMGQTHVLCDGYEKKWENEKECMITVTGTAYISNNVGS